MASSSRKSTTRDGSIAARSGRTPKRVAARWAASTLALYRKPCTAAELDGMPYFFRPTDPCVIEPAKKTPGAVVLSQYGVCEGSLPW